MHLQAGSLEPVRLQGCQQACSIAGPSCTSLAYNPALQECFLKTGASFETCQVWSDSVVQRNVSPLVAPICVPLTFWVNKHTEADAGSQQPGLPWAAWQPDLRTMDDLLQSFQWSFSPWPS